MIGAAGRLYMVGPSAELERAASAVCARIREGRQPRKGPRRRGPFP